MAVGIGFHTKDSHDEWSKLIISVDRTIEEPRLRLLTDDRMENEW